MLEHATLTSLVMGFACLLCCWGKEREGGGGGGGGEDLDKLLQS